MTDFSASKTNGGSGAPNFQNGDVTEEPLNPNLQDKEVVLEIDGRKYTKADLINKITNADRHISSLEAESKDTKSLMDRVNKVLEGQVSLQDVLKGLKADPNADAQARAEAARVAAAAAQGHGNPVTAESVVAQVRAQLDVEKQQSQLDANWNDVTAKLTKAYGAKVNEKVMQVAAENDMTVEEAADLARRKPNVFLKLFPLESTAKPRVALQGNVNSLAFKDTQPSAKSGFWETKTTKTTTAAYLAALERKAAGN